MSRYFCYQANDSDCGFACLKMILAIKYKNEGCLNISKKNKRTNYSFADLIAIGKDYGLSLTGYRYEEKEKVSVKTPFLALLEQNHLVVVTHLNSFKVTVLDPSKGELRMTRAEFNKIWSGDTLEIESFKAVKFNSRRLKVTPFLPKLINFILSISSLASLLVGFFFIKDDAYIFIPLILLGAFISIELVQKWYLIKQLSLFDEKYTLLYFKDISSVNREELIEYSEFKKTYFSFESKIIVSLCASIVIIVALIINAPINALGVLFILLMNVVSKIIFKNKDEKRLNIINEAEDGLVKTKNASANDILKMCNLSNKYAFNISLRNCVYSFLILLLSFFVMLANKIASVNFLIFHFGLYYVLNTYIDTLVSYNDQKKEYERSKARFLDKCNL